MINRDYMDYHSDRFEDHSLLVYENGSLLGCMPANQGDKILYSHQGLSFGGLYIKGKYNRAEKVGSIVHAIVEYSRQQKISKLVYKLAPSIYHKRPANADYYALRLLHIVDEHCHLSSTVCLSEEIRFNSLRKRMVKKATKEGVVVDLNSQEWEKYWLILEKRLRERFGKAPVHTLDEIQLLHRRFPGNIKLSSVFDDASNVMLGGVVIFETGKVAHAQYISVDSQSESLGVLDFLFAELIQHYKSREFTYFDFGISTEDDGRFLNAGLCSFKEGFGASSTLTQTLVVDVNKSVDKFS